MGVFLLAEADVYCTDEGALQVRHLKLFPASS
jgi:hypothetical protein